MRVELLDGAMSFKRFIRLGGNGPIEYAGEDEEPGQSSLLVALDRAIPNTHISLESQPVTMAAAHLVIERRGRIAMLGWVNIVRESRRTYHYSNNKKVDETVNECPQWDGKRNEVRPFYHGYWYGTEPGHKNLPGCSAVLTVGPVGQTPQEVPFNDRPCMPPSYNVTQFGNIHLGKLNIGTGTKPAYINQISGMDKYLACFVAVEGPVPKEWGGIKYPQIKVAWAVAWQVKFAATVTVASSIPTVTIANDSMTIVNTGDVPDDVDILIKKISTRTGSASSKQYKMS